MAGSKIGYLKGKMGLKGKMQPGQMLTRMNEMKSSKGGGGFYEAGKAVGSFSKGVASSASGMATSIKKAPRNIASVGKNVLDKTAGQFGKGISAGVRPVRANTTIKGATKMQEMKSRTPYMSQGIEGLNKPKKANSTIKYNKFNKESKGGGKSKRSCGKGGCKK